MAKATVKKTTQVATKQEDPKNLTISNEGTDAYANHSMTSKDMFLPKLLVMQGLSEKVTNGDAKFGELRDNLDNKLLGGIGKPLEIIPFYTESVWIVVEKLPDNSRKFVEVLPADKYPDLKFEEIVNGKTLIRTYTINVYCLIPSEIEAAEDMPYVLSLRSTSLRAGKKLNTAMYMKNLRAKRDPWAVTFDLSVKKDSNDKGTFAVLDVTQKRASTEEELISARHWYKVVRAGATKVDHSDVATDTATPVDLGQTAF